MNSFDPVILAVETSQNQGSVALRQPGGETQGLSFSCGTRYEDRLLPSIDTLFSSAGLQPDAIDAVAVSVGPGGFTGLRISLSTVKGIAEVIGCDVLAVPSACVAAESLRPLLAIGERVVVLSAAKAGTCWITELMMEEDRWSEVGAASVHEVDPPPSEVIALCKDSSVLADEHVPSAFMEAAAPVARRLAEPSLSAEACLYVALGMLKRGETTDPLQLAPIYPREPEAVTRWKHRRKKLD